MEKSDKLIYYKRLEKYLWKVGFENIDFNGSFHGNANDTQE